MALTVRRINVKDLENGILIRWMADRFYKLNEMYGDKYDLNNFPLKHAVDREYWFVCFHDNRPVGFLFATLRPSIWDITRLVLRQESLYADNPRATAELIRYFIDFGRIHANDVIMCIAERTNLKGTSLEKMGFSKMQTMYRLEV